MNILDCDFTVNLWKSPILDNEQSGKIQIEIESSYFSNIEHEYIEADGKTYKISDKTVINDMNEFVSNNLQNLIEWSKKQNNENLDKNQYDGGCYKGIRIQYGQLTIRVNGQVRDIGKQCDEFIEELKNIILKKCEEYDFFNDFFNSIPDKEFYEISEIDKEFEKYNKSFKEKFGREAYIAEPSGTKEQTIKAIKICLKINQDILDDILYPDPPDPNVLY